MIVRSLRLHNFRNFAYQEVELPPGLIALTGDNGQGKTNFLEALCVLATTRSPLVERDRELMRWEQTRTCIGAEVELSAERGERRALEYEWRTDGASTTRELRAGGVPQSALAQWLGQLQVVAFFPHDLVLIAGDPAERRRFLNLELGKTDPAHFSDAVRYRRALQQRNALLRFIADRRFGRSPKSTSPVAEGAQNATQPGTLAEWNRQLVTYGARILEQRARFLSELQPLLETVHRDLSGHDEPLRVYYIAGVKNPALAGWQQAFAYALEADHEVDTRRGSTQSGPHRDDLQWKLGHMDLRRFGSQGQQRLAVLSLKIALAQWVTQVTGEAPILLLDDALSELDATRRVRLLQAAASFSQSVLTATDSSFLQGTKATLFSVAQGQVAATSPRIT